MKTPLLSALRQAFLISSQADPKNGLTAEEAIAEQARHTVSRRQFLKTTGQAGLVMGVGGAFVGNDWLRRAFDDKEKIAIVGAGLAGLAAGIYLNNAGVKATLFEADKRAGGRVKSAHVFDGGKLTTEFGAEFIDTVHEDMFALLKMTDLEGKWLDMNTDTLPERDTFFIEGRRRTLADLVAELNPVYHRIARDKKHMKRTRCEAKFDRMSMAEYLQQLPISPWMRTLIEAAFIGENGREAGEQSALNLLGVFATEKNKFTPFGESDERFKVIGGNDQIPRRLAEKLEGQIRFGHKLMAVKEKSNGSITLSFSDDGKTVEESFDAVVLAIPFTVLREVHLDLELPPIKKRVIQELGYGTNIKYILETRERAWRKNGAQGYLFNEVISNGWDSSQLQQGNQGVGAYTVFYGGQQGKTATRGTESAQHARCVPVLDTIFPGTQAALTGKEELVAWPTNPFVKASYSCFGPGQVTAFEGQAAAPVRNLYFAGEHCSADWWGFMNGAAETGRLAAQALLAKMKKQ